jgi:hypothetical protein
MFSNLERIGFFKQKSVRIETIPNIFRLLVFGKSQSQFCPHLFHRGQLRKSYLIQTDIGVEFGSGRSTLWFAKRIQSLTSVEHDEKWFAKVSVMLNDASLNNVIYRHEPKEKNDKEGDHSRYVKALDRIETESVDFVLVDGIYRDFCAKKAIRTIKTGGILIIDNVNWYLPSKSFSPNSRTYEQGPKGSIWKEVNEIVSNWRYIWTSSGVTDTAFFFKPCIRINNQ